MRTLTNEFGHTIFVPESITERRSVVNGIKLFDVENGVATSQAAKYEKKNWAFVSDLFVGCDKSDTGALTCHQIVTKLEPHGIFLKPHSVFNIIQQMSHPRKAIAGRRIGQSCVEVVRLRRVFAEIISRKPL